MTIYFAPSKNIWLLLRNTFDSFQAPVGQQAAADSESPPPLSGDTLLSGPGNTSLNIFFLHFTSTVHQIANIIRPLATVPICGKNNKIRHLLHSLSFTFTKHPRMLSLCIIIQYLTSWFRVITYSHGALFYVFKPRQIIFSGFRKDL